MRLIIHARTHTTGLRILTQHLSIYLATVLAFNLPKFDRVGSLGRRGGAHANASPYPSPDAIERHGRSCKTADLRVTGEKKQQQNETRRKIQARKSINMYLPPGGQAPVVSTRRRGVVYGIEETILRFSVLLRNRRNGSINHLTFMSCRTTGILYHKIFMDNEE